MKLLALAALLAVAPVLALSNEPTRTPGGSPRVPQGLWGGKHLSLEVTESGANLQFDCARGRISSPLKLDDKGHFELEGVFVRERPGAVRVGDEVVVLPG